MIENQILKCNCKTVETIQMKDNDLFITFMDGSVRSYQNGRKHYINMLRKNIYSKKEKPKILGVGPYYRKQIRDKNIPFTEIKERTINIKIGK